MVASHDTVKGDEKFNLNKEEPHKKNISVLCI